MTLMLAEIKVNADLAFVVSDSFQPICSLYEVLLTDKLPQQMIPIFSDKRKDLSIGLILVWETEVGRNSVWIEKHDKPVENIRNFA